MKSKTILVLLVLICGLVMIAGCTTDNGNATTNETNVPGYMDITPAEAQQLITSTPSMVIIDVSPEFNEGHLAVQ